MLLILIDLERVRPNSSQACQRGEEQACRTPKTPCVIDEEVEVLAILVQGTQLWLLEELTVGLVCSTDAVWAMDCYQAFAFI